MHTLHNVHSHSHEREHYHIYSKYSERHAKVNCRYISTFSTVESLIPEIPLMHFTLYHLAYWAKFQQTYWNIFLILPGKQVLIFRANCLQYRHFAWNLKSPFSWKNKKNIMNLSSADLELEIEKKVYCTPHSLVRIMATNWSMHWKLHYLSPTPLFSLPASPLHSPK